MAFTVVHLITKLELGGAQQNTLYTVAHLDADRYERVLISGEPGILDSEVAHMGGVRFYQVPRLVRAIRPFSDIAALIALTRLLLKIRPAIVHTHSSKAGILGRWAARFAGTPIVIHSVHGFGFTPAQHPLLRWMLVQLERITGRVTTRFFVVSEATRRVGIERGIFPEEKVVVIRSGIDLNAYRRSPADRLAKRRELGLLPSDIVVGMVAPLKPQKAPLDFVRVAARVVEARPGIRFILAGDGDMRPAVQQEIDGLGLGEVVRLIGWRRDVADLMHCFDVFLLTSRWEGLPRVYLEALSSGVPVVGTRVDGADEVIEDGVNGFLVDPGDTRALADRILSILSKPGKAQEMGRAGTALPLEFDIREMVRQQEREYEHLLKARGLHKHLSMDARYATPTEDLGAK